MAKASKKSDQKLTLEAIANEFRRSVGVVTENLEHKVDLVLEQHGDTVKRLDTHMEAIGRIEVTMTIIKEQIAVINSGLKKKVDIEEFEALERRVNALEKIRK